MKDQVTAALLYYHSLGKEWVSLKEIYEKVEEYRGKPNANGGASIRRLIEDHSKVSDGFGGEELYISKGKGTGLYKSIYYDRLEFINQLVIGDILTRDQLMKLFKVSGQSGIMKSNSLNSIILTTSEESIYEDSNVEDGTIQYTGEGLEGDQKLDRNNKSLFNSKKNKQPVYLFTKDKKRRYIFEGLVELYDEPYQSIEKDINGKERLVWKFPLKIIYSDNDTVDENIKEITYKVFEVENSIELNNNDIKYDDGPLEIRKYRKSDIGEKINRAKKPDYIAEEMVKVKQGQLNEKVIYEGELKRIMALEAENEVKKMEDFFNNRNDSEGYDILSYEQQDDGTLREIYIEVKSTKENEGTPIDITDNELEFARQHKDQYYLYRIFNSNKKSRTLKIVTGKELFESFDFIPSKYKIYSK